MSLTLELLRHDCAKLPELIQEKKCLSNGPDERYRGKPVWPHLSPVQEAGLEGQNDLFREKLQTLQDN